MLIWSPGRVERVADGLTDSRSARARKILPAGALLWSWEADKDFDEQAGQTWLILLPNKFNRHAHYGWRFAPEQLAQERRAREAGPPVANCMDDRAGGVDQWQCNDSATTPRLPSRATKKSRK